MTYFFINPFSSLFCSYYLIIIKKSCYLLFLLLCHIRPKHQLFVELGIDLEAFIEKKLVHFSCENLKKYMFIL